MEQQTSQQIEQQKFRQICRNAVLEEHIKNGIGTLGEKTLHMVLKNYFEPDISKQEIRVGAYIADIVNETGIIEIQTQGFDKLRKKLAAFLPLFPVTVVYPIPAVKWLIWIDPETGETTKRRKSPRTGRPYDAFYELYKIKFLLNRPNLRFCLAMIEMEEYRFLNGWSQNKKKGASRYERIPLNLLDLIQIPDTSGYLRLIPETLPETFTSADFKKASGLYLSGAGTALHVLNYLGTVTRTAKRGNAYLYQRRIPEDITDT